MINGVIGDDRIELPLALKPFPNHIKEPPTNQSGEI